MQFTATGSNGRLLPLESLEMDFTYDGDFPETITVTYDDIDYVQTFTNDGTNITNISKWVAQ